MTTQLDKFSRKLTSMSLEPLLIEVFTIAGTMGLLADGDVVPEQCWGMLGETGSILTMAGAEPRQTDWDKTTTRGFRLGFKQRTNGSEMNERAYRAGSVPWGADPAG